jgi:superfamily II DNA/RNA helicase
VIQFYRVVESDEGKLDTLRGLKDSLNTHHTIIYASNRLKVDWLFDEMASMGCSVARVHEDTPSKLCDDTVRNFRNGVTLVVVTSLVAHRLDVAHVPLVIHYDLPSSIHNYAHNISRTGRFGRRVVAINLVTVDDLPALKQLEVFGAPIEEMPANVAELI